MHHAIEYVHELLLYYEGKEMRARLISMKRYIYHSRDILLRSMGKMKQLSLYIQQASEPDGPDGGLQKVS